VHRARRSHEIALERIGLYLKGTLDEGLILKPSGKLDIDCYFDADFASLWPHEDKHDPTCVKSRTGFVICISDCPVIWSSKRQTDIATSTMEAEYNGLSLCMRDLLPFKRLFLAVVHGIGLEDDVMTTFRTTVWEDNNGALGRQQWRIDTCKDGTWLHDSSFQALCSEVPLVSFTSGPQ